MNAVAKKWFMFNKLLSDLRRPKQVYQLAADLHSRQLGHYYFLFQEQRIAAGKDQALIQKFDRDGIPINRTYIDVTDKAYVYFPISIGQMGLAVFHTWLATKKAEDKNRFLKFADWYVKHVHLSGELGARWLTDVALPQYRNPGPWASAFAQSRAISILLRAWQLTGDKPYVDLAEKALIPFLKPVAEGGVTAFTEWGPFYEEYTAEVPTLVLNGKIFSLCGVYDLVRVFPQNEQARQIFDSGMETLKAILPEFNLGYWSRYNLCRVPWYPDVDPATVGYQRLHATQLEMLYQLSGEETFRQFAQTFRDQDRWVNILRMLGTKYRALKKISRL